MRKTIIFKKLTPYGLPDDYKIYLDSFLCNCIRNSDCRLSNLISNYTKNYNPVSRPYNISDMYMDCSDECYNYSSEPDIIKITFSSDSPEVIQALLNGIRGKVFQVHDTRLEILDVVDAQNEYVEELYSFS
ncbi:hypothetical protein [Clostridium rectalis]|uniref:hypothetical protein n=1 Tax=Clostridium rectalis TaxID=2040295 RepID=UPI000F643B0D|nr:hypothetical protein [Clostridium rectalis]